MDSSTSQTAGQAQPGYLFWFYESEADRREMIDRFLLEKLDGGSKLLYIGSEESWLRYQPGEHACLSLDDLLQSGRLELRLGSRPGYESPETIHDLLDCLTAEWASAAAAGFSVWGRLGLLLDHDRVILGRRRHGRAEARVHHIQPLAEAGRRGGHVER